jgi:CheY-like chemotaxis protein
VDLNTVVANMEKMLRRLIGEDVRLVIATASTPYVVRADPRQLEQVLMNLAVNARDAMPGGGTLTIETRGIRVRDLGDGDSVTLAPGGWVLLDVRDTGVGMTQETIDRAFEPFFTTKGQGEGTGLGLPTVYGIVQQSGGTVWIQSAPGAGTTVTIALPELAAAPADTSQVLPDVPSGSEPILVVEDDDMLRDMARLVLSSAGYDVLAASSGENALVLLEQRAAPVALLLTDVVMPGMTGRELAEAVLARWPQTRVLYMSGYTDDAIVRHGVLDGVTEFINKPFGRADILAAVRRAIDGGPARQADS